MNDNVFLWDKKIAQLGDKAPRCKNNDKHGQLCPDASGARLICTNITQKLCEYFEPVPQLAAHEVDEPQRPRGGLLEFVGKPAVQVDAV